MLGNTSDNLFQILTLISKILGMMQIVLYLLGIWPTGVFG